MTGFARVRKAAADGEIAVSIKSVNHRGLDMHFHMAPELDPFEGAIRNAVKAKVARGHLQIHVLFNRNAPADASSLNRALLQAYLQAFREAADEFGAESKPDLNVALRIPGMLQAGEPDEPDAGLEQALLEAAAEALDVLNRFREREGAAMAAEMRERCAALCELVGQMEKIRSHATQAFQKRLSERLRELLRGAGIEPQRLAQEAALLAERSDISEELMRLKTHAGPARKAAGCGRRGRQTAGFPAAGDEPGGEHNFVENRRSGRPGPDHHRPGAGGQGGDRQAAGAIAELGITKATTDGHR